MMSEGLEEEKFLALIFLQRKLQLLTLIEFHRLDTENLKVRASASDGVIP